MALITVTVHLIAHTVSMRCRVGAPSASAPRMVKKLVSMR